MSLRLGKTIHRYISPVATPRSGYTVAIPHPVHAGRYIRKNFVSEKLVLHQHLADALSWRDARYLQEYGRPVPARTFHRRQRNSVTELPGVRRVDKVTKKKLSDGSVASYTVPCMIAIFFTVAGDNYKPASGSRSKVFSIKKYGEEEATRRAVEWRNGMIATLVQPGGAAVAAMLAPVSFSGL